MIFMWSVFDFTTSGLSIIQLKRNKFQMITEFTEPAFLSYWAPCFNPWLSTDYFQLNRHNWPMGCISGQLKSKMEMDLHLPTVFWDFRKINCAINFHETFWFAKGTLLPLNRFRIPCITVYISFSLIGSSTGLVPVKDFQTTDISQPYIQRSQSSV